LKHLLFFLALLAVAVVHGQKCSGKLRGHVHSSLNHETLERATVMISETGRVIITDAKGDFVFDSLCAGKYTLLVSHVNYDTLIRPVAFASNQHIDLDLIPSKNTLSEVIVNSQKGSANTGITKNLSGKELEETRGLSLAAALSRLNGVRMLQTGTTVAKPVIHGLHGNRILTINNGVRQEGQQWGNEHAPEIDPFIANRLTVIKGVDELRYGSDAIGGVILVEPRALRTMPGYNAEFNTLFFTNNRQFVASAIFEQQLKQLSSFTYRLQGTYKKGANVATPHYRLNNTALEEKNMSFTAGWRREHFHSELYYSLFNTQAGIFSGAHIGSLSDLQHAIASSRPDPVFTGQNTYRIKRPNQDVTHHLLKWKTGFDVNNSKFNVLLAGQYNHRKEYDVVRNAAAKGAQINLSVFTFSEEINWEHPKKHNLSGVVGVVALQQDNSYSGRYLIPNYRAYSYGAYAIEKWTKGKWDAQAGIRFDNKAITTNRLQAASGTFTSYQFDFSTLASSVNLGYKIHPQWHTNASVSLATRAPHVNELLTNGVHHGTGTYEVGDIHLKPEKSFNIAWNNSYTSQNRKWTANVTLYRNRIQRFIYQQPKPDEPVLTIRGAFPKIQYQATDALLQGMDLSLSLQPHARFMYNVSYALLRARNKGINDWLIGMPADRITNELTFTFDDGKTFSNTYISLEAQNTLEQTRVPDDRNGKQDYKVPPAGYMLLNAHASTSFKVGRLPVTVAINATNLFNTTYRDYLNAFRYFTDEMGRNISLRLKISLEHIY
jgi:iron complex outermembrane receptor protein